MNRLALRLSVAAAFCAHGVGAQAPTKVGFVHGFNSDMTTWDYTVDYFRYLVPPGLFSVPAPVSLPSLDYASVQVQTLKPWLYANHIDNQALVVAHSMGGLVTRLASRDSAIGGLLTIGTPGLGAPIAGSINGTLAHLLVFEAAWVLVDWLTADYPFVAQPLGQDLASLRYWLDQGSYKYWFGAAVGLFFLEGENNALADLAPSGYPNSSGFISWLDSTYSTEQIAVKRAAVAQLDYEDYQLGPLVLLPDRGQAYQWSSELYWDGYGILVSAVQVLMDESIWLFEPDYNYWEHTLAAWIAIGISFQILNFAGWWHNGIVGDYPNDGVVPINRQVSPGFARVDIETRMTHLQETRQAVFFDTQLRAMKVFLPSP